VGERPLPGEQDRSECMMVLEKCVLELGVRGFWIRTVRKPGTISGQSKPQDQGYRYTEDKGSL
jgi:hypothetical protein